MSKPITRVVLDTNVLVGSAYNERSSSRAIIDACFQRRCRLVVSPGVLAEYEHIVPRAVRRSDEVEKIKALLQQAERVEPDETPRVVADDPEDDKFLAVAVAGKADALVTNDEHLLCHDPHRGVRVVRPGAFCRTYLGQSRLEEDSEESRT